MGSAFDFSPLFRSTIGFDRLMHLLEGASNVDESTQGYPPYNIEKTDEHAYRITLAVAGFAEEDLHVETRENTLVVAGRRQRAMFHRLGKRARAHEVAQVVGQREQRRPASTPETPAPGNRDRRDSLRPAYMTVGI